MTTGDQSSTQPLILVVDDDEATREVFAASLRLAGFRVRTAVNGIAALTDVDEQRPDVILLDLDLPIMNGFAVHEALRMQDSTRDLPVVIVSGRGWQSPSPIAARLDKPVPADALITTMFDVLARAPRSESASVRQIVWLCPRCRRVMRETQEAGHPMTSEMRMYDSSCESCVVSENEKILRRTGLLDPA